MVDGLIKYKHLKQVIMPIVPQNSKFGKIKKISFFRIPKYNFLFYKR